MVELLKSLILIGTKVDDFTKAYIECALWSSIDNQGNALDAGHSVEDIVTETLSQMEADCKDFQQANTALINEAKTIRSTYDTAKAGHDFWLTRNGHGAGFWDRGLEDVGDKLTEAAKVYGHQDLWIGEWDGLIHSS